MSEVKGRVFQMIIYSVTPLAHYYDVIMGAIESQIISLTIVYSIVYSDADQRKHQSFASLDFVRGMHRGPVNSPPKWPVTRKMFPFDDVIMLISILLAVINQTKLSNNIRIKLWYINTHPCPNFSGDLVKQQLKLGNGWFIAPQNKQQDATIHPCLIITFIK